MSDETRYCQYCGARISGEGAWDHDDNCPRTVQVESQAIRPELPDRKRRLIEVGQVWTVDFEVSVRWFVLTPGRVIALFAGGADHTPASLVFTYGDRLRLEQTATVYADSYLVG